ncbi:MAG TPA: hypothetical protein VFQ53_41280 [Kofleriaceae bacterium]|nr:hypothetical protein [Kofleriaceae bacterium]
MKAAAFVAVVLLSAKVASAQPGMTEPAPLPPAPAPVAPQASEDQLSENTALALSIGGTVVPWVMFLAAANSDSDGDTLATVGAIGTMFGPSLGHWYAHDILSRGLGLRALGVGAAFTGAMVALTECPLFSEEECHESAAPAVLLIAGAGLYIAGTIDDIATAPGEARQYNRDHSLALVPTVTGHSGGLTVVGSF